MKYYECKTCNQVIIADDDIAAVLDLRATKDCKKLCNLVEVEISIEDLARAEDF